MGERREICNNSTAEQPLIYSLKVVQTSTISLEDKYGEGRHCLRPRVRVSLMSFKVWAGFIVPE